VEAKYAVRKFIKDINKHDFDADAPDGESERDKQKRIEATIENDILN
jgi:hypothetical protein